LTSPPVTTATLSIHILRQKNDYFSSLFAKTKTKNPHFIVYFSENEKKMKKKSKKFRRAIKTNNALTIKLCTSKKKRYILTVAVITHTV